MPTPTCDYETFLHDYPIVEEIRRTFEWEQANWAGNAAGHISHADFQAMRQALDVYKGTLLRQLKCPDVGAYTDARRRFMWG